MTQLEKKSTHRSEKITRQTKRITQLEESLTTRFSEVKGSLAERNGRVTTGQVTELETSKGTLQTEL
jgi:hypothetical protein